jgi:Flp pilus assembly protein TadD
MKTKLMTALMMVMLIDASSAQASLFGKAKAKKSETPAATASALNPQTQFGTEQVAAKSGYVRATKAERALALRSDYLTQAAFFSQQYEGDPGDSEAALYLSNALRALGRYQEAADYAHRALLFVPNDMGLLMAAARAHIAGDQAFFAIDPLNHVI